MRYIMEFKAADEMETHTQEFPTEEDMVAFIQMLRLPQDGKIYPAENFKITPVIPVKSLVFNKKTFETRVVKAVDYRLGTLEVYNSDLKEDIYKQELGYVPIVKEIWLIEDCIILDSRFLQRKGFFFGTSMGRHKQYQEMEIESLGISY